MSPGLHSEFGEVRKFYFKHLNCNREETAKNNRIEKKNDRKDMQIPVVFETQKT